MMATCAVFGTYELLEGILTLLSPRDVTRAMRVSREWHDIILNSKTLHNARILVPLDKTHPGLFPQKKKNTVLPLYHQTYNIKYQHAKDLGIDRGCMPSEILRKHEFYKNILDVNVREDALAIRTTIEDKYITIPPCQALNVRLLHFQNHCTVHNREGVKVRDVHDAGRKLWELWEAANGITSYPHDRMVFVQFQTVVVKKKVVRKKNVSRKA